LESALEDATPPKDYSTYFIWAYFTSERFLGEKLRRSLVAISEKVPAGNVPNNRRYLRDSSLAIVHIRYDGVSEAETASGIEDLVDGHDFSGVEFENANRRRCNHHLPGGALSTVGASGG
jgi:hypothetical protein